MSKEHIRGKNSSTFLGEHFEQFIVSQVETGRYGNRSEVIRSALRDMEERERTVEALRQALIVGEESGPYGPLDMEEIILAGRKKAGLDA